MNAKMLLGSGGALGQSDSFFWQSLLADCMPRSRCLFWNNGVLDLNTVYTHCLHSLSIILMKCVDPLQHNMPVVQNEPNPHKDLG